MSKSDPIRPMRTSGVDLLERPVHILRGEQVASTLSEADVHALLLTKLAPYISRNESFEAFKSDVAHMGGTFGDFFGWWDTKAASSPVVVKLSDNRNFEYSKRDLFHNPYVQVSLL